MRAFAGAGLLVLAAAAAGQSSGDPQLSAHAEAEANLRRERIAAEIARLDAHAWAGDYYAGDGLDDNAYVSLAPEAGFLSEWFGCLGFSSRNYGAVSVRDGRLMLEFTFPNEPGTSLGLPGSLIVVPWGDRRYLVPADDVIAFCNAVNQGEEPRRDVHGEFLLRRGDERKKVTGLPTLPSEWVDHILESPVEAAVVAVGAPVTRPGAQGQEEVDWPVTIDAGSARRLCAGMELFVVQPADRHDRIRLVAVTADRSEAVVTYVGRPPPPPAAGWRFSTRPPRTTR